MGNFIIHPSKLQGTLSVPPSKSHTMRALLFATLAEGTSRIEDFLLSPDTFAMIEAIKHLGAKVRIKENVIEVTGTNGHLSLPEDVIQCGNSGQVFRFIGALAGLLPGYTILTGDESIRNNRPAAPLLDALMQLGAFAETLVPTHSAPLIVRGPFTSGFARLDGQDSQPVSGLLIAAAFAPHPIEFEVINPGEMPWIDLTLDWLKKLKIPYQMENYTCYRMEGNSSIKSFSYRVPGDFSTAAFPIVAALITHSPLTLHNVDMNDCQGDKKIIPLLEQMGASFTYDASKRILSVQPGKQLDGIDIDINACIDALPIMAVAGCFAKGRTTLYNGAIARRKESDRIQAITTELKKMGADIEEKEDGVVVHGSKLKGADLLAYNDHRLALSLTVASLGASSAAKLSGTECIAKTYPNFFDAFTSIGARIEQ